MDCNKDLIENKNNKVIRNILKVAGSNIFKLLSGVLVGFLIPKILGVTEYGHYKTFTLYATYVGLFHFGIIDGIYLKYGGYSFEELDKSNFRFYSRFFILLEAIIMIFIFCFSFIFLKGTLLFTFLCLSIYLFFMNLTSYYQIISQITGRFNELSFRNIIQSILTIISVIILYVIYNFGGISISYKVYTVISILIIALLSFWYMYTYKSITFGNAEKTHKKREILYFMRTGFPLTIANLSSSLIINLDRQFVNILFDTDKYAIYAFAYSLLSLVTTATSAISVVIYTTLKRTKDHSLKENYNKLVSIILGIVFCMILTYYPLCFIVDHFLDKYHDSLIIFRIIFPGLAVSSVITIIMHNYYKVLNKSFNFFVKSLIILGISFIANILAYLLFKSTISISISSIFVIVIWYFFVERLFIKHYKIKCLKNTLYLIISIIAFYIVTSINNYYIGFCVHILTYLIITLFFYSKSILSYTKKVL